MPVGNSGATRHTIVWNQLGFDTLLVQTSVQINTTQKSYIISSAYLPWHVTVDPMLQYPCASISPRPRRGPGEVSVAVVSSSPPPLPQICFCFCWWQQRGAAAASLLVKFMTRRDTGTKPPLLLLRIHPLSSPAPAHPLSNTPQQGQVPSPRVRISNHKCGATVSVE